MLAWYARLLARTVRLTAKGERYLEEALQNERPLILAAWHGQSHLLYPLIRNRVDLSRLVLMVVDDDRRHVLASFARGIGGSPFPISGDDESMAGARNLIQMARLLRSGRFSYIVPDGPDGPARVAKPGIAFLAARAEANVIPFGAHSPGAYRVRRWDRYSLPIPFGRIRVVFRPPIQLASGEDTEAFLKVLSDEMTGAIVEAEEGA